VIVPTIGVCSQMNDIMKASDGGIVMCGGISACNTSVPGIFTAKLDSVGNILWLDTLMLPFGSSALSIIEDFNGNYVLTGFTSSADTISNVNIPQFFINKYNESGILVFTQTYGDSTLSFQGRGLTQLSDSSYVVVGDCYYPPIGSGAFISIVSKNGQLVNSHIDDIIYENVFVRIKSEGMIATTIGFSNENKANDTSQDIRVLRYSRLTDSIDFRKTINMLGSQSTPYDLELLPNGNVAISFYEQSLACIACTGLMVLDSTACAPELCNVTGAPNSPKISMNVYPNPFYREVFIESDMPAEYWFYNTLGVLLKQGKTNFSSVVLFDENLLEGLYFMVIKVGDNTYTHKLIHNH